MSRDRINASDVARELVALVEIEPQRVDRRPGDDLAPRYVEHGRPNCLVAAILSRLGISMGVLKQLDRESGRFGGGIILRLSEHAIRRRFTPRAWAMLDYLQRQNDHGVTWAKALEWTLRTTEDRSFMRPRDLRPEKPWLYEIEETHGQA